MGYFTTVTPPAGNPAICSNGGNPQDLDGSFVAALTHRAGSGMADRV
ncbi:MAG: hypothetical protein WBC69_05430 [Geitlerinemataceae cyanobacterium]